MNSSDLQALGLSAAESSLYLSLLRFGPSTVANLIKQTGMYKANIYQSLERLYQKGIVSHHIENAHKIFRIQSPDSLLDFIAQKEENIAKQKKLAEKLIVEVNCLKKLERSPESAEVFYGLAGVKKIYRDILERKLDCLVYGSPSESEFLIGDYYWKNLHQKQRDEGLKMKMIFHKSLRHWKNNLPKEVCDLRFFDDEFEPLTETTIYGDTIALTVWEETPIVTIIQNKHVATSYKQIFEMLWKQAKK